MERYGKLSRLYRPEDLKTDAATALDQAQAHYLKNVLRKNAGDTVRIFNGRDGEFLAEITEISKRGVLVALREQIREQPAIPSPVHLLFAPIKKNRMDMLIEKAVELGATHIHPVLTARTENRHINTERLTAQIIEAAEQCERMDVPVCAPLTPLKEKLARWDKSLTIYWGHERSGAPPVAGLESPQAFLIGPEGGFDDTESAFLSAHESVKPISLGRNVYRAETAAFLCLSAVLLKNRT